MKLILKSGLLAAMVFALVGASPAHSAIFGAVGTASGCKAGKAKCVTKMKSCMLGCYGKAFKGGIAVDQACLDKCRNGFLADPDTEKGCMNKLDLKNANCGATIGDDAVIRSKVEAHVAELVSLLNPTGANAANGCLAGKAKCVSKYNACVLGIVGKAFKAGVTVGDLSKCNAILTNAGKDSCVQKLETKNPPLSATACRTYDDQGLLKTVDDAFVNDLIYGWVGSGDIDAQRCSNDTSIHCTTNAACGAGTCQFFFGSPLPLAAGGIASCVVSQWNGGITGTFEQENGKSAGTASVLSRVYTGGNTIDQPCPVCNGADLPNDGNTNGLCNGGARNGLACDRNGESPNPTWGYTSLDCPPNGGTLVATLPVDLSNRNDATVTKTLSASSPSCNGSPGNKCMCASCSLNSSIPCASDADCTAAAAGTCTNTAGEPRKPNACLDDTTNVAPPQCIATAVAGEGACELGPVDLHCQIEKFRSCSADTDCPVTGDKCITENRACFPGYNGQVGNTISATGKFGTPHNHTGTSTFASVFCVAPTSSSAVNSAGGLPGPGRLALGGVASEDGGVACPTVATFLPTAKSGVLDTGWTGLAHNASVVGQGKVTVSVTSCTGSPGSCHCSYAGPVAN
jgi:hypothetical protein